MCLISNVQQIYKVIVEKYVKLIFFFLTEKEIQPTFFSALLHPWLLFCSETSSGLFCKLFHTDGAIYCLDVTSFSMWLVFL